MNAFLQPDDYQEQDCPLCMDEERKKQLPIKRIIEKLDEYLNRNDYATAEKHLTYWLKEAAAIQDCNGLLSLYNERMGLFRKLGKKDLAISDAETALSLVHDLQIQNSTTAGTTMLNAATVFKAFGCADRALPLYEEALRIYRTTLSPNDALFGGLYNNMALSLVDLGRYANAEECYFKALDVMSQVENGELDCAITYLNMADAAVAQYGLEQASLWIEQYIAKAEELLNTPSLPRNGYYAFVAEKCASTFRYYGYFLYANELKKRARRIYERN